MTAWQFLVEASGPASLVVAIGTAMGWHQPIRRSLSSPIFWRICWWLVIAVSLANSVFGIVLFGTSDSPLTRRDVLVLVMHLFNLVAYLVIGGRTIVERALLKRDAQRKVSAGML